MAVPVQLRPRFRAESPRPVFAGKYFGSGQLGARTYDVSPDGQRFLMIKQAVSGEQMSETPPRIIVVQNWTEELKRLTPR